MIWIYPPPHPVRVTNKGLVGDSLLNLFHYPGFWQLFLGGFSSKNCSAKKSVNLEPILVALFQPASQATSSEYLVALLCQGFQVKAARSLLKRCRFGLGNPGKSVSTSVGKQGCHGGFGRGNQMERSRGPILTKGRFWPQVFFKVYFFIGQNLTRIHLWWWNHMKSMCRKWLDAQRWSEHSIHLEALRKLQSHWNCHAVLLNARITTGESASNDGDDLRLESNGWSSHNTRCKVWVSILCDVWYRIYLCWDRSTPFVSIGDVHEPKHCRVLHTLYKGFCH